MLRDINARINPALTLSPAARTATANGSTVDTQGFGSAAFVVAFGAYTDGTHTPSAQHSDDGTTWTTCAATEIDGTFTAVSSAGGANTVQRVGYLAAKRYLRVVMTIAGATTGAATTALIVRSHASQQPA